MLRRAALGMAGLMLMSASALSATPAFSVHKNGTNQTVAAETDVKLTWSTEGFDTNNNFATDRFTPTVAGKYLIVLSTECAQAGACMPSVYKNGVLVARSQATNFNIGQTPQVSAIVDMNGSTDYVEAFVNAAGTAVSGTANRTYFSGMQLDGSGGGGGSSQWSDGTGGAIYYNSGNVGIGTATPQSSLHIKGTAGGIANIGYGNSTQFAEQRFSDEADNPKWSAGVIGDTNSVAAVRNSFYIYQYRDQTDATVSQYRLTISDTGNVGIGVAGPTATLHVHNGSADATILAENNGGNVSQVVLRNLATGGREYALRSWGSASNGDFAVDDNTSGQRRLTISATGNVGIGTTTPALRLDVSHGDGAGALSIGADVNANTKTPTTRKVGRIVTPGYTTPTNNFLLFGADFTGATANNLFIGGETGAGTYAVNNIIFSAESVDNTQGGTERMRITGSGNVGIGTATPLDKLDVRAIGYANNQNGGITIGTTTGQWRSRLALKSDGSGVPRLAFDVMSNDSGGTAEAISIVTGGNVGIGTTTPASKLDVNGTIIATTIVAAPPMMILADEKANGTAGGTCTSGSWFTRTLNTVWENSITGGSLSSDQFTLPAGKYLIRGRSPGVATNRLQARLYNVTDAAVSKYGSNGYGSQTAPNTQTESVITAIVTIAASKAFRIEHQCNTTKATNGLGIEGSFGGVEIYTTVEITKIQ